MIPMRTHRHLFRSSLALAAAVLGHFAAYADDWPQWRGSNREGVWKETDALQTFPADSLPIRWRVPCGNGWSSPVIANGRVSLLDAVLESPKATERIRAFDAATGQELWKYEYEAKYPEWAFDPTQMMGPYSTTVADSGRVYSLGAIGQLHCLDAAGGHVVWSKDLTQEYQCESFSGCCPSPIIEGDLLIVVVGGKPDACIIAFDNTTGKEVWKALSDTWTYSSPIIITANGKRQLIEWTQGGVNSLDPATGAVYWRLPLVTSGDTTVPTPVRQGDHLLVSGLMLKLDPDRPAAEFDWPARRTVSNRTLSNTSTPVIQGDYVYSAKVGGLLVCLDARTGQQVWETDKVTDLAGGAAIHITLNGDSALLFNDRGELIRAKLTPEGYQELSRTRLIEPTFPFGGRNITWSAPSYANGHVFVRNHKELLCVSLEPTQ